MDEMKKYMRKMMAGVVIFWVLILTMMFFSIKYTGEYVVSHGGLKAVIETIWYGDSK